LIFHQENEENFEIAVAKQEETNKDKQTVNKSIIKKESLINFQKNKIN
jgi:hypothetical protein